MAFDTYLLDEAIARRRAALERERQRVLAATLALLEELGPRFNIQRAYLFGSVAHPGRFTEDSDVDIAVDSLAPGDFFAALANLATALGREVDLVELNKCHFAHRIRTGGIKWTKTPSSPSRPTSKPS